MGIFRCRTDDSANRRIGSYPRSRNSWIACNRSQSNLDLIVLSQGRKGVKFAQSVIEVPAASDRSLYSVAALLCVCIIAFNVGFEPSGFISELRHPGQEMQKIGDIYECTVYMEISDVYILYVSHYNKYNNLLFHDMGVWNTSERKEKNMN